MIYILIIAMVGFNPKGVAIAGIEFNSKQACQAAAKEWQRQYEPIDTRKGIVMCAEKGSQ